MLIINFPHVPNITRKYLFYDRHSTTVLCETVLENDVVAFTTYILIRLLKIALECVLWQCCNYMKVSITTSFSKNPPSLSKTFKARIWASPYELVRSLASLNFPGRPPWRTFAFVGEELPLLRIVFALPRAESCEPSVALSVEAHSAREWSPPSRRRVRDYTSGMYNLSPTFITYYDDVKNCFNNYSELCK